MLRNLAFAGVSAASAALLLILFVVAGHLLGDAEFGKFSFALALGTIFETLMDFGLHQVTIRAVARDRTRAAELLRHTLGIKLMWASVALVALSITATLLRPQWDVRLACYLIGGSLVLRSYMLTIRGVLQGLERFGWDSAIVVADRGILLVFGVVALVSGTGLIGISVAFVAARGTALLVAAWMAHRHIGTIGIRFDRATWKDLQVAALPLGFFLIVLNLYSYIDSVMLGVFRSDVETGLYTAAYRLYEGLAYAPSVIASVLTPRLSGLFVSDPRAHARLARLGVSAAAGLALVVGVAGFLLAEPLMRLLFGPTFQPAAAPFRILCVGLTFVFSLWILHAVAISVNCERLLLKTGIIGLTVNVGVNLYAIPHYGAQGAAVATVIGECVSVVALIVGLRSPRVTRVRVTIFCLLFTSYAYFYQAGGWNQNSRFDLVRAVTNEHSLRIDPFQANTGDKARFEGHYYSDKAPGVALAAVPVVFAARAVMKPLGFDPESYAGIAWLSYLATVFAVGLLSAVAGVVLFDLCVRLGASPSGAVAAVVAAGLGSPMWPLATLFLGHAISASCLVIAFAAILQIGTGDGRRDIRLGALGGVAAGWATVSEFPAAVPAVCLALLALWTVWPLGWARTLRVVGALGLGALGCAAVLMAYQYACFGSPFHLAYSSEEGFEGMRQGWFGISLPKLVRLRYILTGDYRGLLPMAPVLALAPVGLARLALGGGRAARAALVATGIAAFYVLLNASYTYWEGGWSFGPRHLSPGIPFACVGLAFLWTAAPAVVRVLLSTLIAWGVACSLIAVSTMAQPPASIRRPMVELMLPAFLDGDLALNTQRFTDGGTNDRPREHTDPRAAWNVGMKAGLSGLASLAPLAGIWLAAAFVLASAVSARQTDGSGSASMSPARPRTPV